MPYARLYNLPATMAFRSQSRPSAKGQLLANIVGRAWVLLSNLIFFPIYLHLLGMQSFGIISLFMAVVGLITFLDMGLSPTLARELNDQAHSYLEKLNLLFTYEVIYTALVGLIILASLLLPLDAFQLIVSPTELASPEVAQSIRLVFVAAAILMLFNFYIAGLLGIEQQIKGNLVLLFSGIVRGALVVVPLWFFPTPKVFLVWQLITVLAFTLVSRGMLYKYVRAHEVERSPAFERAALLRNFSFMGSVFIVSVTAAINTQIDKIFIGRLTGLDALASYSLVSTFALVLVFSVTPITITLLPRFVRMVSSGDIEGTHDLLFIAHRVVAAIVCTGVGSMIWFGPYLISLWTAGKLAPEAVSTYLPALVLGYGLLALSMVPHCIAIAHKNMRGSMYIAYSVFLTVPSFWFFIGRYGLEGAAVTWLVLQAVVVPFYLYWIDRTLVHAGGLLRMLVSTVLFPLIISVTISFTAYQLIGDMSEMWRNLAVISLAVLISLICCFMITLRRSDRILLLQALGR